MQDSYYLGFITMERIKKNHIFSTKFFTKKDRKIV